MAKPKVTDRILKLEEDQKKILGILETLVNTKPSTQEVKQEVPTTNQFPIPREYIEAAKGTLNSEFGINIVPLSDQPAFQFNVIVPEKYSPLTEEQRRTFGSDMRSKVISYADGVNGVKIWLSKVFDSFNPEIKALIVSNR